MGTARLDFFTFNHIPISWESNRYGKKKILSYSNNLQEVFLFLETLINKNEWNTSDIETILQMIEDGLGTALNELFYNFHHPIWKQLNFPKPKKKRKVLLNRNTLYNILNI